MSQNQQGQAGIEITPAMLAAGVKLLSAHENDSWYPSKDEAVREIYCAMLSLSRESGFAVKADMEFSALIKSWIDDLPPELRGKIHNFTAMELCEETERLTLAAGHPQGLISPVLGGLARQQSDCDDLGALEVGTGLRAP